MQSEKSCLRFPLGSWKKKKATVETRVQGEIGMELSRNRDAQQRMKRRLPFFLSHRRKLSKSASCSWNLLPLYMYQIFWRKPITALVVVFKFYSSILVHFHVLIVLLSIFRDTYIPTRISIFDWQHIFSFQQPQNRCVCVVARSLWSPPSNESVILFGIQTISSPLSVVAKLILKRLFLCKFHMGHSVENWN